MTSITIPTNRQEQDEAVERQKREQLAYNEGRASGALWTAQAPTGMTLGHYISERHMLAAMSSRLGLGEKFTGISSRDETREYEVTADGARSLDDLMASLI